MLFNYESQLRAAHELAKSLLPADNSDLPTTEELCGILREEKPVALDVEPIKARLAAVKAAARDNEVDLFNREHHARWDDIELLLDEIARLRGEVVTWIARFNQLPEIVARAEERARQRCEGEARPAEGSDR